MKYCHECGYQLHSEDMFCANCGTKQLVETPETSLEQKEVVETSNSPMEQTVISIDEEEYVVDVIQVNEKKEVIENPQETTNNLSDKGPYILESDISENMEASSPMVALPEVEKGYIRFQWNGAELTLNLNNENFRKLKLPERIEFLKDARIHIEVNDKLITSEEGNSYREAWYVDIPIESESMTVDVWLSLKEKNREKPSKYNTLRGALFGSPREVFNINLNSDASYTFELTEPLEYITIFGLFGYLLKDSDGNVIDSLGATVNPKRQLLTFFLPILMFIYARNEDAKNDRILKNSYLISGVTGIITWILLFA